MLADRQRGKGGTLVTMQFGSAAARDLADQAPGLEWLSLIDGPIEGRASAMMMQDGSIVDLNGVALLERGALDLGGDKMPSQHETADERNPFLGWRGFHI